MKSDNTKYTKIRETATRPKSYDELKEDFKIAVYKLIGNEPVTDANKIQEQLPKIQAFMNQPKENFKAKDIQYVIRINRLLNAPQLSGVKELITTKLTNLGFQAITPVTVGEKGKRTTDHKDLIPAILERMGERGTKDPKILKKAEKIAQLATGKSTGFLSTIASQMLQHMHGVEEKRTWRQEKAEAKILKHKAKKDKSSSISR